MSDLRRGAPPRLLGRRHAALTLATGMASLLDSSAIIAVGLGLALWRDAFDLDVWMVGATSASLTVAIAVGALVGGRLGDLLGRTRVFTATVLLYAAGAAVVAVAPTAGWLLPGLAVLGLASGADLPTSLAVLAERAPAGARGRLVASTHVLWTAGVVLTTAAGLALSGQGLGGIRVVFGVLALLALGTAFLRGASISSLPVQPAPPPVTVGGGLLSDRAFVVPLVLTGAYYTLYTLVAGTFGSFRTYLLVVVGGASQTTATAIALVTGLVGLAGTVLFALIADSAWRPRLFPAGVVGYATALVLLVLSGGTALPVVALALVVQNLSFPFVGDALYKVWTQELFTAETRSTAQGATICVARLCAGGFALVTPALVRASPTALFALLLVLTAGVGAIGPFVARRVQPAGQLPDSAAKSCS